MHLLSALPTPETVYLSQRVLHVTRRLNLNTKPEQLAFKVLNIERDKPKWLRLAFTNNKKRSQTFNYVRNKKTQTG